jgi:predicted MPP superfamily phosphohydrolase
MKIVVVGDMHCPFENKPVLKKIYKIIEKEQPDAVVQIGDLYDLYQFSRYPKRLNMTPEDEVKAGRKAAEKFWNQVQKAAPLADCFQLIGNHDIRPYKTLLNKAPELEMFVASYKDLFEFEGVKTMDSSKSMLELGDATYHHGYRTGIGYHMVANLCNMVVGHSHLGGVVYRNFGERVLWELNVGHAADTKAFVFDYGEQTFKNWTSGVGIVDDMGPRFIPLN